MNWAVSSSFIIRSVWPSFTRHSLGIPSTVCDPSTPFCTGDLMNPWCGQFLHSSGAYCSNVEQSVGPASLSSRCCHLSLGSLGIVAGVALADLMYP